MDYLRVGLGCALFEGRDFSLKDADMVLVLILLLLQARAMEKRRNEAREEALAILEQLEQAEADEEIDRNDAAYEERETENEGAGHSGRLAFGDLAVASRAQNAKRSKSKRTDDDYSDLDLDVDDEDDDDDVEDDEDGKKRKFKMHQTKNMSSKEKLGKDDINSSKEGTVAAESAKKRKKKKKNRSGTNLTSTGSESLHGQGQQISTAGVHVSVFDNQTGFQKSGGENMVDLEKADSSVPGKPTGKSKKKKIKNKTETIPSALGSGLEEGKGLLTTTTGVVEVSIFNKQTGFQSSKPTVANIITTVVPGKNTSTGSQKLGQSTAFLDIDDDDDLSNDHGLQLSGKGASQEDLIRQAFAGDDVEADFQDIKSRAMDEEVAKIEEPKALPGWGQWTHAQRRREHPGWKEELENKRREEAMKKRKDANLKFVVISEKLDKKVCGHLVLMLNAVHR